jgi:acyl-CoA oxidase
MPEDRTLDAEQLLSRDGLIPLLPLLYAAWIDGTLTADEKAQLTRVPRWLDDADRKTLATWLEPDNPPPPTQMLRLRREIRSRLAGVDDVRSMALAAIGVTLAGAGTGDSAALAADLEQISAALGFGGTDMTQEILDTETPNPPADTAAAPPGFDVEAMQLFLDGPWAEQKRRVRELLAAPEFRYRTGLSTAEQRQQTLDWLQQLCDAGLGKLAFPGVTTDRSFGAFFATFETLASFDLSLLTKFGVQVGLFGGSIYHLGTEEHRKLLPEVATLELPGCFAMSELGHGSNVRDLETVARYDIGSREFIVTTPSESARKEWIGNAAQHGRMATVFAQLEVGDERHGVHAFLVPLRDEHGDPMPGVRIADCGEKMGLNGVDNGRLWFDDVRIPRQNLLSRFGQVSKEGAYESPIPSAGRRFFTMLRTLVGGRIAVGSSGVAVTRSALTIAVRYTSQRRQFGAPGREEQPILDYRVQQLRLMPLLARAYALSFAIQHVAQRYVDSTDELPPEIEALAAAIKAIATANATRTVQACREACGGQGYLAGNRFAALKADSEIFVTYEGDNTVLLQLVAKGLLASFKAEFGESKLLGVVRHLASQTATAVLELNPVTVRLRSDEHLRDPEFQLAAFRYRETSLVQSLARRLKHRIDEGMEAFTALNECQDHAVAAAEAFAWRQTLEQFQAAIARCATADGTRQLVLLRDLFALHHIHEDAAWFLEAGYVEPAKSRAIRDLVGRLAGEARHGAEDLVDAFGIPDTCLGAPIGLGEPSA